MDWLNKSRELVYRLRTRAFLPGCGSPAGMILMLHRVVGSEDEFRRSRLRHLHITASHLENLLITLREQGCLIISLEELWRDLQSGRLRPGSVVLTFDDAYRDTYEQAFPILQKHGAPFTLYVPTAVPDNDYLWWHYLLDDLVERNESLAVTIGTEHYRFDTGTAAQKLAAYRRLEADVNAQTPAGRRAVLETLFAGCGLSAADYRRQLSMTWDQLADLCRSGIVTLGGHTVNHDNLALMSLAEAENEIMAGKRRIEEQLGITVEHFSFPFGSKSAAHFREFDLAARLGFKTCTTSRHGFIVAGHRHYLERLPRITVDMQTDALALGRQVRR